MASNEESKSAKLKQDKTDKEQIEKELCEAGITSPSDYAPRHHESHD